MRKIIMASKSPRRKELMEQAGYEFEIIPSSVEEIITKTVPSEVVEELATQKAQDVFDIYMKKSVNNVEDILVIGADTIVSIDGKILGKPKDKQDAYNMIKSLQGKTHQVYTGVCLVWNHDESEKVHSFNQCTEVKFYSMTDDEIWSYVYSNDPMDKAGAYGIQGRCATYIEGIQGDYNNVVGLPIGKLYQEIKNHNIDV